MTETPEDVERPWAPPMLASLLEQMANQPSALDSYVIAAAASRAIGELRALSARVAELEAERDEARARVAQLERQRDEDALEVRSLDLDCED